MERLPTELVIQIVGSYLPSLVDADEYLTLRLVNKHFNHVVLYALFDLRVCDTFSNANRTFSKNEDFIFRYWRAILASDRERPDSRERDEITTRRRRYYDSDSDEQEHSALVKQILRSAITRIVQQLELMKQTIPMPNISTFIQPPGILTVRDRCIYVLCMASIQLHGRRDTWKSLAKNIELSYFADRLQQGALFIPNHHETAWEIYAAAYLDDLDTLKRIIGSIKMHPTPRRLWRYRLSLDWNDFVLASPWESRIQYENATVDEQKWIKLASSALVIASSMGHVDIIDYLMRIEPYFSRNGPRTQLWSTSLRSAMGQAVVYEQRGAFNVFLKHKWPLLTSTGFPRMNWWNGLRIALETVQDRLDGNSIFESMLDMSPDWKCHTMVDHMLQAAASRNNMKLARVVLDRLHSTQTFLTYSYLSTSVPGLSVRMRAYALGTAAWLGRVELVDLLLQTGQGMSYAGTEARTCAIHTLVCQLEPEEVTVNHLTILKNLLNHTDDIMLEQLLFKATYKHNVEVVSMIARKTHLTKPCPADWLEYLESGGKCLNTLRKADNVSHSLETNWGEVVLAAALNNLKFKIARILISEYQVSLDRYFVRESARHHQFNKDEVNELEKCFAENGMTMKFDEREDPTYFEFWPTARPEAECFRLVLGRSVCCPLSSCVN